MQWELSAFQTWYLIGDSAHYNYQLRCMQLWSLIWFSKSLDFYRWCVPATASHWLRAPAAGERECQLPTSTTGGCC